MSYLWETTTLGVTVVVLKHFDEWNGKGKLKMTNLTVRTLKSLPYLGDFIKKIKSDRVVED